MSGIYGETIGSMQAILEELFWHEPDSSALSDISLREIFSLFAQGYCWEAGIGNIGVFNESMRENKESVFRYFSDTIAQLERNGTSISPEDRLLIDAITMRFPKPGSRKV